MHNMIRSLPSARNLLQRQPSRIVAQVNLSNWNELDEATCWCAEFWRSRNLRYGRRVIAETNRAVFLFDDETHAVEFKLRFG
jgi:hypothetical protein